MYRLGTSSGCVLCMDDLRTLQVRPILIGPREVFAAETCDKERYRIGQCTTVSMHRALRRLGSQCLCIIERARPQCSRGSIPNRLVDLFAPVVSFPLMFLRIELVWKLNLSFRIGKNPGGPRMREHRHNCPCIHCQL